MANSDLKNHLSFFAKAKTKICHIINKLKRLVGIDFFDS